MNEGQLISYALRTRCNLYCTQARKLTGGDPSEKSRRWVVVYSRMMVAYRLLLEGWSQTRIGALLGVDHATASHYRRRMADILSSPGYGPEQELWKQFNETI